MPLKIAYGSDFHLEFGDLPLKNTVGADVLILAGDICIAKDFKYLKLDRTIKANRKLAAPALAYLEFFQIVASEFPHVIYVLGNHEHYGWDINTTATVIREALVQFPNIHVLEKDSITIEDVTFIGSTLWTDLKKGDPLVLAAIPGELTDYRLIENHLKKIRWKYAKLTPLDVINEHKASLNAVREWLGGPAEKVVVVSHHAPHWLSLDPRFEGRHVLNSAYASDLSEFILDHPQIKVWVHGHIHVPNRYTIGDTVILANPRGYLGHDPKAAHFQLETFEL